MWIASNLMSIHPIHLLFSSLKDLADVQSGVLEPEIQKIHDEYVAHICENCELCRAKGFVCEQCQSDQVIFPFGDEVVVCPRCSNVFHRLCFRRCDGACRRCDRIEERRRRRSSVETIEEALWIDSPNAISLTSLQFHAPCVTDRWGALKYAAHLIWYYATWVMLSHIFFSPSYCSFIYYVLCVCEYGLEYIVQFVYFIPRAFHKTHRTDSLAITPA